MEATTHTLEPINKQGAEVQKKSLLQRIKHKRRKVTLAIALLMAGYYGAAHNTKTPHKIFASNQEVLTAIDTALGEEINWQVVELQNNLGPLRTPNANYVSAGYAEPITPTSEIESISDCVHTCVHWVTSEGPNWAYNYQNTNATEEDRNCNCKAAEIHTKLHAAGIPSITVSAKPKDRSTIANSWHQFVVVKLGKETLLVFDENVGETIFCGTIEDFLLIQSPPMQLATIGPFNVGTSEYGESTFNNALSRLVRTWHNATNMQDIKPIVAPVLPDELIAVVSNRKLQ